MDMYTEKWTRLQASILRFLSIKSGKGLNLRAIASALKKSPTAVSNALRELEKEGFVKVEKAENINLLSIELNRDNPRTIELKRTINLKMVYESGLADLLRESFPGTTVILFGSYSKGEDVFGKNGEGSDIDLAVIGTKGKDLNVTNFEKKLERKVIVNYYSSFKDIHKDLRDSILNGIVLSGSVDL